MRAIRRMLCFWLVVASLTAPIQFARAQQTLPTDTLMAVGARAYRALPDNPTLSDAPRFSIALSNLFAYEQRAARDGGSIDPSVNRAFEWLVGHIDNLKTGKADYSGNDLLDRGMERFHTAQQSQTGGRIWDVRAYVSARANLYAYIQCEGRPHEDAVSAHAWLLQMASRLAVSGGAADDPREVSWLPSGPKPRIGASIATIAGTRVSPTGTGAKAGRVRIGGERGSRAITEVSRPADRPAASPVATASDSVRDTSDKYQQLAEQLASAQAENERLRRENADLRAKLEEGRSADAAGDERLVLGERLRQQGRLPESRKLARTVLAAGPSRGDAHLLLARIYATASANDPTPEGRAVVWLAIDHLVIAIKQQALDYKAGVREVAELEARTPTSADLKARGWVPGQRLRISFAPYAWIDEETTVRVRKE